jgi:hypothetical protein
MDEYLKKEIDIKIKKIKGNHTLTAEKLIKIVVDFEQRVSSQ